MLRPTGFETARDQRREQFPLPCYRASSKDELASGRRVRAPRASLATGETTLAQIIRMVGEAQTRRAPSEQWVDRFARVYTPVVFGLAVLVARCE